MNHTKKAWINLGFLAVTLVINALGAVGVINGMSQKEISDMYLTLITPSASTFSIWSLIYLLLIISLVVMVIKKEDAYFQRVVDQISLLYRISCVFNIAWIVAFSFLQVELSTLFIIGFVLTLSLILQTLLKIQEGRRWLLPLSFGLYTGWLFIATVVNVAAALVKLNWNGFGVTENVWAIVTLIVAAFIIIAVLLQNRNAVFPLPIAWAYFGIYQFLTAPEGFDGAYPFLQVVSLIGMAILIGAAAIQLYRNNFSLLPVTSGAKQENDGAE